MKVLCVIDDLGSGGAQRQLVGLARELKMQGYDVSFLIYYPANFYKNILEKEDIKVEYINCRNHLSRMIKCIYFIRHSGCDAIISFLETPSFICECASFPFHHWKLIVGERSSNPQILSSFKLRAYRWFHILADKVVANSCCNINMIKKICPILSSSKCSVIYNMIDTEKWTPRNGFKFLQEEKYRIVVAASHQYNKNLNSLVEAVHLLSSAEKKKLKIDWYGDRLEEPYFDNSYLEALKKIDKYSLQGIFAFYPATLGIIERMRDADAIGLFSKYEGLPNAVCEGMSLGKPIIATNVSDNSILIEDNVSGFLSFSDKESISDALSRFLNSTAERLQYMGKINREKAIHLFEKKQIVDRYLKILNK